MRTPLSRQGFTWSRYRCKCGAISAVFCLCGDISAPEKRVTFEELEARNLSGLFSKDSADRIHTPLADWRGALYQANLG
jgi:hypothetical protein